MNWLGVKNMGLGISGFEDELDDCLAVDVKK